MRFFAIVKKGKIQKDGDGQYLIYEKKKLAKTAIVDYKETVEELDVVLVNEIMSEEEIPF
jgi:hypothetical protein